VLSLVHERGLVVAFGGDDVDARVSVTSGERVEVENDFAVHVVHVVINNADVRLVVVVLFVADHDGPFGDLVEFDSNLETSPCATS